MSVSAVISHEQCTFRELPGMDPAPEIIARTEGHID